MGIVRTTVFVTAGLTVPGALLPPPLYSGPETAVSRQEYELKMFSQLGLAGHEVYMRECANCHGKKGFGSDAGPSLHRRTLSPQAFHKAVTEGVPQTRWKFGDMPAKQLSFNDIELVARYMREVRKPNNYDR